jgi:hypothetical protein
MNKEEPSGVLGESTCEGGNSGKDYAWSWGLGYEFSPIKTRSAHKKAGTNISFYAQHLSSNIEQTVLRGMKALARAKS